MDADYRPERRASSGRRSLDVGRGGLPVQLTSFVGRTGEVRRARAALLQTRLLTLTGPGGVGKTRLAVEVAAAALEQFDDGLCWVELAAVADPAVVAEALSTALGVRPLPGQSALEAGCAYLERRQALLVLDNCEHLRSACTELAETVLRSCASVTVMATSRAPLGAAGETQFRVPPLSLPAAGSEPSDASDAARLFVERARKARPDFEVDGGGAVLDRICRELDGLPLAIELAAARVRMLSLAQIAAGLGDRFQLLTGGTRTAPERQQTLRGSVEWSHSLLSAQERILFRRLAVFTGSFTLEECAKVAAGDDIEPDAVLDVLGSLVDQSLVNVEDHGTLARYRLLETLREYASRQLDVAMETQAIRTRYCETFLALAELAAPELESAEQRRWLDALDADAPNLAAALAWATQRNGEWALRMCTALTLWWRMHGRLVEGELAFERALDVDDPAPSALRARALWGRAHVATFAGRFGDTFAFAEQSQTMASDVGDDRTVARTLLETGSIQLFIDPVASRPVLERVCELAISENDDWSLVHARSRLGFSYVLCDEYDEGHRRLTEIEPLAARQGLDEVVALGRAYMSIGRLVEADFDGFVALIESALELGRGMRDSVVEGFAELHIGWYEQVRGRPDVAISRLEAARELVTAAGLGIMLPYLDTWKARACAALGDLATARTALEAVVASGADYGRILAIAKVTLVEVQLAIGDLEGADVQAREAREIGVRITNRQIIALADELSARVAIRRGDLGDAETLLHASLALRAEYAIRFHLPQAFDAFAELFAEFDRPRETARILGGAQHARDETGVVRWAPEEPRILQLTQSAREALGEDDFAAAWHEGASLTLDEAIAWLRRGRGERKRPSRGWASLTPTELQVAQHVAVGLTNAQIGERMFISRGTVKIHVSHIFAKLGMSARAELAAEMTRRSDVGSP